MSQDIVPTEDALDFSRLRPGDAIILSWLDLAKMGKASTEGMSAAILGAARKAGLSCTIEHRDHAAEVRITFARV